MRKYSDRNHTQVLSSLESDPFFSDVRLCPIAISSGFRGLKSHECYIRIYLWYGIPYERGNVLLRPLHLGFLPRSALGIARYSSRGRTFASGLPVLVGSLAAYPLQPVDLYSDCVELNFLQLYCRLNAFPHLSSRKV